jgi:hypothetical protein
VARATSPNLSFSSPAGHTGVDFTTHVAYDEKILYDLVGACVKLLNMQVNEVVEAGTFRGFEKLSRLKSCPHATRTFLFLTRHLFHSRIPFCDLYQGNCLRQDVGNRRKPVYGLVEKSQRAPWYGLVQNIAEIAYFVSIEFLRSFPYPSSHQIHCHAVGSHSLTSIFGA